MENKDDGTILSDDFLAELYLHKCGLNRQEQKDVFEKAGGKWDPQKIRDAILTYYEQAHELDGSRAMASREHKRRPNGVYLVGYDPDTGEGTDLVPDLVEKYDPNEDLDTTGKTFNTANPVYYSQCDNDDCDHAEEEGHQVMWTNTNLEDGEGGTPHRD